MKDNNPFLSANLNIFPPKYKSMAYIPQSGFNTPSFTDSTVSTNKIDINPFNRGQLMPNNSLSR